MNATDIVWASGFFDGEGCIYIGRQRANNCNDLLTDSFRLYIKVSVGDKIAIKRLKKIFCQGSIHDHVINSKTQNDSYQWMCPT